MRIPAECDRDADIVLDESAIRIEKKNAALAERDAVIEAVRELIVEECEIASITNGVSLSVAKIRALLDKVKTDG
jgi:hypothetical protein